MSILDEVDDRGLASTAILVALSLVSANRGARQLFGTDLLDLIFGQYAPVVAFAAGLVGLVTLAELLLGWEVFPDDWRL